MTASKAMASFKNRKGAPRVDEDGHHSSVVGAVTRSPKPAISTTARPLQKGRAKVRVEAIEWLWHNMP